MAKVGNTRIVPIGTKILVVFICLLLLSNFATNFINIQMNKRQTIQLTNEVLVNRLKDIYSNAVNQFEIYKFSQDEKSAIDSLIATSKRDFKYENSLALGVKFDGSIFFVATENEYLSKMQEFSDADALQSLKTDFENGTEEGSLRFKTKKGEYLSVYKYHSDWKAFLICGELISDTTKESHKVFLLISIIIIVVTFAFMTVGIFMFRHILQYIAQMTESLYSMQASQRMDLIDLSGAPNDDVTYLGTSFNALSATINNLLHIFQKFATKDVVDKAYSERIINLEGTQKELTVLFSDIRGFTYMTEVLGNDIINLLNIHYDKAIRSVHEQNGIIGSIIGVAVLAVFGAIDSMQNKSVEAVRSAWNIIKVTEELREKMIERRQEIEQKRKLTEQEEKVYKAVLLEVGVGIDGGTVFYGNIGSSERMTNTVIGDNVNSSARLEGLTRIYSLPVIVSEYVKNEVEEVTSQYQFFEIDMVQVKGKTEGVRIFFPIDVTESDEETISKYEKFEIALKAYYEGDWTKARRLFNATKMTVANVFLERMGNKKAPEDWSGIWTMTTK
jgi:class 3 adenylate cyclase